MRRLSHVLLGKTWGGVGKPGTFIEFTKRLIDELNAFHTNGAIPPTYGTVNMGGIHFYDSVVVIEKKQIPFQPFSLKIGKTTTAHFADAL